MIKFKYFTIFIVLPALTFSFSSCSKSFINLNPVDAVSSSSAISSSSGMQTALYGTYSVLRNTYLYGRDLPVIGDLMADNSFIDSKNTGRYITPYQYTFVNTDDYFTEIWEEAYLGILSANKIINSTITDDTATVSKLKSQAYALRALLYFKLLNIYAKPYTVDSSAAGVPLVLTDNASALPARNTVGTVYNQIISDLTKALYTPPSYSTSIYFSKYAIEGLLSKVYLYTGQYAKALSAAKDVISNSGFTLVDSTNYASFWANAAARTDKVEVLFEVDADKLNNNGYDDFAGMYENGYDDLYCDSTFYTTFSNTDVRKTLLISGTTKSNSSAIVVNKFPNASNSDRDNIKVLRLAEVYLIAAEAAYRSGDETTAKTYLSALATARDSEFSASSLSGTALLDTIISQRRKELAFEGDRFYDLKRLQVTITRVKNPGGLSPVQTSVNTATYFRVQAPIPYDEISANANITQNTGY